MSVKKGCDRCGQVHYPPKFKIGDRVRALSMMPHIFECNPFGCAKVDHTGDVGVVVRADFWDSILSGGYIVNFEPDPQKAWEQAPFDECMLEGAPMAIEGKYGRVTTERKSIPENEPVFLLRAQDKLASPTVRIYAAMRRAAGDEEGASQCEAIARLMESWPVKKDPD
ncbi:MAG: hypothetical protein ACREDF_04095 [Thermoplasmata archaeon]